MVTEKHNIEFLDNIVDSSLLGYKIKLFTNKPEFKLDFVDIGNLGNITGIYQVINIISEKSYIGKSSNVGYRLWEHLEALEKRNHKNIDLQRDFIKCGKNNFLIKIVHAFDTKILEFRAGRVLITELENYWIKSFPKKKLYNQTPRKENLSDIVEEIEQLKISNGQQKPLYVSHTLQQRVYRSGNKQRVSHFLEISKDLIEKFKWQEKDTIFVIPNDDGTILLKNSKK